MTEGQEIGGETSRGRREPGRGRNAGYEVPYCFGPGFWEQLRVVKTVEFVGNLKVS